MYVVCWPAAQDLLREGGLGKSGEMKSRLEKRGRTKEGKVWGAEALCPEGSGERRLVTILVHVKLRDRGDDAQVEAVRVGMVLVKPSVREGDKQEPIVLAERVHELP